MDITMCTGIECPIKETCLRYKGEVNKRYQSFFKYIPVKDGKCEYYWEIKEHTPLTEKEEMDQYFDKLIQLGLWE
jgi:hypothetical protein